MTPSRDARCQKGSFFSTEVQYGVECFSSIVTKNASLASRNQEPKGGKRREQQSCIKYRLLGRSICHEDSKLPMTEEGAIDARLCRRRFTHEVSICHFILSFQQSVPTEWDKICLVLKRTNQQCKFGILLSTGLSGE